MNKYGLFGKFTAIDGERDNLVNILLNASKSLLELEDCENYTISTSKKDENAVYVYEIWKNEQAHDDSLSLESVQLLIKQAMPIIKDMETIANLEVKGGKGVL